MERGMTVVGHCQLLRSGAWEVSSYTCFPSGFLNKFQRHLKVYPVGWVNRPWWTAPSACTDSRMGLDSAPASSMGRSVSERGYSWAQRPLKSHAENFVYKVDSVGTSHQEKKKPHGQYYIIQINLLIGDFPVEETLHHAEASKNKPGTCICSKHKKSLDELLVTFFG